MTDFEIRKIKEHIEIHAGREPRAVHITEILRKAVAELERHSEIEKEKLDLSNELTKMTNVASFQQSANMNRYAENKELKKRLSESRKVLRQILSDYKDMGSISKELIEWADEIVRGK